MRLVIPGLILSLSACGGGGSSPSVPAFAATPTPTPTPTPATINVSPSSINLIGTGASQSVTLSESGYTGNISIDASNCSGIATTSSNSLQGPSGSFTLLSGSQGGTCTVKFTGQSGQTQSLGVTVTITQGVIQ